MALLAAPAQKRPLRRRQFVAVVAVSRYPPVEVPADVLQWVRMGPHAPRALLLDNALGGKLLGAKV